MAWLAPDAERELYMKFIVGVVKKDDAWPLIDVLVTSGYRVTTFKTTEGFCAKRMLRSSPAGLR